MNGLGRHVLVELYGCNENTLDNTGYASVDVYTCGDKVNPYDALQPLVHALGAEAYNVAEVKRGLLDGNGVPDPTRDMEMSVGHSSD